MATCIFVGSSLPTIKIIKQPACFVKYYKIFAITHRKHFGNEIILFFILDASTGFLGAFTGIFKWLYKKKNPCGTLHPDHTGKQNSFYYSIKLGGKLSRIVFILLYFFSSVKIVTVSPHCSHCSTRCS